MMLELRTILSCVAFKVCRVHLCQLENSKVIEELRMYFTMLIVLSKLVYCILRPQVMFCLHMHTHCWMTECCQSHEVF